MEPKTKTNTGKTIRTELKFSDILSKIIYVMLTGGFVWALVNMFACSRYNYDPLLLGGGSLAALVLIVLFWLMVKKHEAALQKYRRFITIGFLAALLAIQIALSFPLRFSPVFDVDALYGGAMEWTNTGTFKSYYEYFGMFHNNFGGLLLLRIWFGIMKLIGVKDYFIPACILNSLVSVLTVFLTGSCAQKLFGIRGELTAYFVVSISLPFLFIAPAFYTDALTMVFPVLILRLWLEAKSSGELKKRFVIFTLMGLASGVGYGIKATVLIMLIAVIVEGLLYDDVKTWLSLSGIATVLTLCIMLAVNGIIYGHIGRIEAKRKQVPITHWIMMGLSGWGGYNRADYKFTKSLDPAERSQAIKERIAQRIEQKGIGGILSLWNGKIDIVWNDGTYGLSDCLGCPHEKDNILHEFLVDKNSALQYCYRHITASVLAALYVLLIASCVLDIFAGGANLRMLAPRLALLGLFIFFLIWEARWRYFSNYAPIIMLCALIGTASVTSYLERRRGAKLS